MSRDRRAGAARDRARGRSSRRRPSCCARFGERPADVQAKSTPTDLVSEADVAAERAIRSVLARRRPDDSILGEEGGATGDGELRWVVDPLDGTINFLFGIPVFAVSVACEDRRRDAGRRRARPDPRRVLRRDPVGRGDVERRADPRIGTCSSWRPRWSRPGSATTPRVRARQAAVVSRVLPRVRDIRRGGAAALDLVWCACGRYDAYYERGVHAWDMAAGALIARAGRARGARAAGERGDAAGRGGCAGGADRRAVRGWWRRRWRCGGAPAMGGSAGG